MNRRYKRNMKNSKIRQSILSYINNNIKEYIIFSIIFLLGIIVGIIFINNISENQEVEINNYISSFLTSIKENNNINNIELLKASIKQNSMLAILLWFMGSTVIGIVAVYFIIVFRGFCLGYTISSIIITCGTEKGIIILATTIFLQYILFIPAIISLGVSGMRLYKSIMKDKRKENIKIEILRHTIFSFGNLCLLLVASLVEVYVSKNLLIIFLKYI